MTSITTAIPERQMRASDEPQHGHASRNAAGLVHQVAQDQPVSDADNEAWPEYERPITDGDERLGGRDERAGIRARSRVPQRHDRKETDDADGDEGAFSKTSGDISKSEAFVLPLEDREQHHCPHREPASRRWDLSG
jgi:hypothetical protein